jgi:hypothetical protein
VRPVGEIGAKLVGQEVGEWHGAALAGLGRPPYEPAVHLGRRRLEVTLSALLSSTTTVKSNAAALVRTDLLTRYQAHESAIRAGWKLRSEVRELEDLAPIPGMDDQPEGPRMIPTGHVTSSLAIRDNSDGRTLVGPLLPWASLPAWSTRAASSPRPSSAAPWPAPSPPGCPHRHPPPDAGTLPIGVTVELEERAEPPGAPGGCRTPCLGTRSWPGPATAYRWA